MENLLLAAGRLVVVAIVVAVVVIVVVVVVVVVVGVVTGWQVERLEADEEGARRATGQLDAADAFLWRTAVVRWRQEVVGSR